MSKPYRVGFCVSGGGRLFRAAAWHAARLGITPALAVGETGCAADLPDFCAEHQIAFIPLDARNRRQLDLDVTRVCVDARLDLLCLTFDRIIPPALVQHYCGRIINVHMGLLPAFKGNHALKQAFASGVRYAGATIHEVDEEVDHGAIIAQCLLGIRSHETQELFGARLFNHLRLMFLQVLKWYASGRIAPDEQGKIWVRDAIYGEFPISPALEDSFPD